MNKIVKFCSFIFIMLGLCIFTACSGGASGIKGELSYEAKRNELEIVAEFEKNSKLEDSGTTVSIKLYDEEDTYKNSKDASLENSVRATVTFSDLEQNTKYIVRLFVSVNGYEEEIDKIEATTKNEGYSEETAIAIQTAEEFLNMKNDAEAYYKLEADIDFDGSEVSLFVSKSTAFSGKLFGNGHTLKNIQLAANEYSGLFGYMDNAVVQDMKIENISLSMTSSVKYAGAIAGYINNSRLENISIQGFTLNVADGKSLVSSYDGYMGGFVGKTETSENKQSYITNCTVKNVSIDLKEIKTSSSKSMYSGLFAGQLAGETEVLGSSAEGSLTAVLKTNGTVYVGGFAGANSSARKIATCYTDGSIALTRSDSSSKLSVGGFIGANVDGWCNLFDCLAIQDITLLAADGEDKAIAEKLANPAYIGGFIGNLANRSPEGVKNCLYVPKQSGIKVITLVTGTTAEETTTYDDILISLTIAKISPVLQAQVENVYAMEEALAFNFSVKVDDEAVTDMAKLAEIRNQIVVSANISSDGASMLSDVLQEVLKNRA